MEDSAQDSSTTMSGVNVYVCAQEGTRFESERDVTDLIGKAYEDFCEFVVIPVERLTDEFFQLKTRIAGEIAQKFVNYRIHLVVLGDISDHIEESPALEAFVKESNRGDHVWFVQTLEELDDRLKSARPQGC
jgi:Domain of unknown function (DUF4180)